jgi:prepilin-type N-terminal cleavage/methylation domain-containing protein
MSPIDKAQASQRRPRRRSGFTLIEVLITTLLFAIAAQGLVTIVVNTLTAIDSVKKDANQDSEQRFVMRQLMQISDEEALEEGGDIQLPSGETIEWRAEHEPTDVVDLHKVTFELRSSESFEDEALTLYLLRPWLSESIDRESLLDKKEAELDRREFRAR